LQRSVEASKGKKIKYEIDSSRASVNTAKLNLSYTKVYAEVDGYVSNINFQIGS